MLACASNQDPRSGANMGKITQEAGKIEKTYEFYFNLSQVQMKQQLHQLAFRSLLQSYELARQEDHHQDDAMRFKI
jgi:hypothetical protein